MLPIVVLAILTLLLIAWFLGQPRIDAWRRGRVQAEPFPPEWRAILRRRVPLVASLPADLQLQLKKHIQVFLAEKAFIGCKGQLIDDEVRVTIAAQACLLILKRPSHFYPGVRQILVYPNAFLVDRVHTDDSGVVRSGRDVLAGESWSQGQVILSWKDVLDGAAHPEDGVNVVVHEFAHQLDFETGYANGAPDLGAGADKYARWSSVMQVAYEGLCIEADGAVTGGREPFLDPYGATNPAEFFAVVSEAFFGQARDLAAEHPALYAELKGFYRLDPVTW